MLAGTGAIYITLQVVYETMIVNGLVYPCSVIYMESTAPKEKATGEKRPATALELGTYALSRSFSHVSTRATENV